MESREGARGRRRSSSSIRVLNLGSLSVPSNTYYANPRPATTKYEDAITRYGEPVVKFAQAIVWTGISAKEVSFAFGDSDPETMKKNCLNRKVHQASIENIAFRVERAAKNKGPLYNGYCVAEKAIKAQLRRGEIESDLSDSDLTIAEALCCVYFLSRI